MLNREDLAAFRRLAARAPASPAGMWPAARQ
jgi:hypothetical protein